MLQHSEDRLWFAVPVKIMTAGGWRAAANDCIPVGTGYERGGGTADRADCPGRRRKSPSLRDHRAAGRVALGRLLRNHVARIHTGATEPAELTSDEGPRRIDPTSDLDRHFSGGSHQMEEACTAANLRSGGRRCSVAGPRQRKSESAGLPFSSLVLLMATTAAQREAGVRVSDKGPFRRSGLDRRATRPMPKVPFIDSDGNLVTQERRKIPERRHSEMPSTSGRSPPVSGE